MTNFFFVETPFQLLSAMEAKEYFEDNENILLIKYSYHRDNNNNQIDRLLPLTNWDRIIKLKFNIITKIIKVNILSTLKRLMLEKIKFDRIFLGVYASGYQRLFTSNLMKNEVYVIDDGTVTLELQKNYLSQYNSNDFSTNVNKTNIQNKLLHIFGFKTIPKEKINIFSCFDILPHPGQLIIKHDFLFCKNLINNSSSNKNKNGVVYFLGQAFAEKQYFEFSYYINLVRKIRKYYKDKSFIYVPHRAESRENICKIKNISDITIEQFSHPCELEFAIKNIRPHYISSFCSTALYTLRMIYPDASITSFKIPAREINPMFRERIQSFYEYFEKYVNVIDV
jgi:hypothetical protein